MTETRGKDFNFFQVVNVMAGGFPVVAGTEPDVLMTIRGPRRMMFVCPNGANIQYSFNGQTVHGRISSGQIFNFDVRAEDKIWFRGAGVVDVHAWHIGV